MDGPKGYYAKWNKSDREILIAYNFTYIWTLRNKINKIETDIHKEIRLMVHRRKRDWGTGQKKEKGLRYTNL